MTGDQLPGTPIDGHDRRIIAALQRDARISNRELARIVGLAPSTTAARLRSLERRGVIVGYAAKLDRRKLDLAIEALVFIRLRPKTDDVVTSFLTAAIALDGVLAVTLITGNDDAVVHVAAASTDALRTVVLAAIGKLPGVVDERTSLVFEHRMR